jgi:phytoene dehydrogenase-like protein
MTTRFYDAVVIGRSLGALVSAALLARWQFRVLLLGNAKPSVYRFDGHPLLRRGFSLVAGSTPVWDRTVMELALGPTFRQRSQPLSPSFGVAGGSHPPWEMPPDGARFARELNRALRAARPAIETFYAALAELNSKADAFFSRDLVLPPEHFRERLDVARGLKEDSLDLEAPGAVGLDHCFGSSSGADAQALAHGRAFARAVRTTAAFSTNVAELESLPPFALARLHGSWVRGMRGLPSGEFDVERLLVERIEASGGTCRLDSQVESIFTKRGAVNAVLERDEEEPVGAGTVIFDGPGEDLTRLTAGHGVTKRARRDWPRLRAASGRFLLNAVVRDAGVPEALAPETFLLASDDDDSAPAVHLRRMKPVGGAPGSTLLVAETLLTADGPLPLEKARTAVMGALDAVFPFLSDHLEVVDSPHDGLPLLKYSKGVPSAVPRTELHGARVLEPMSWLWATAPRDSGSSRAKSAKPEALGGLMAEPVRGPVRGSFLVGNTVLPALGQEGQLLAAWSASRLVTGGDPRREKFRRHRWSRLSGA